jgi:hypothetical protein
LQARWNYWGKNYDKKTKKIYKGLLYYVSGKFVLEKATSFVAKKYGKKIGKKVLFSAIPFGSILEFGFDFIFS